MEYAGYVQRNKPTDWSKVTGGIAKELRGIEGEREKKREGLDKLYQDTESAVTKVEMGQNPEFNEVILSTANDARALVYDAYKRLRKGDLAPSEFRNIQNNIQSQWGEFDTAVKQKNNRFAEIEKRMQEGTSGERELWQNKKIAEMSEFKNYKLAFGKDGKMAYLKVDPKTGEPIPGTGVPMSSLNKTPNVLVDRFDVAKKVNGYTKLLGKFTDQQGNFIVSGSLAMKDYDATKETIVNSVLNTDNDIGDALMDGSEEEYFLYQEGDAITKGQEHLAIEIKIDRDGNFTMHPTGPQKKAAKILVRESIDSQVGFGRKGTTVKGEYTATQKNAAKVNFDLAMDIVEGKNLQSLKTISVKGGVVVGVRRTKNKIYIDIEDSKGDIKSRPIDAPPGSEDEAAKAIAALLTGEKNVGKSVALYELGKEQSGREFKDVSLTELDTFDWKDWMEYGTTINDEGKKVKGLGVILEDNILLQPDIKSARSNLEMYINRIGELIGHEALLDDLEITMKETEGKIEDDDEITIKIPGTETKDKPEGITFTLESDRFVNVDNDSVKEVAEGIQELINKYVDIYNKQGPIKAKGKYGSQQNIAIDAFVKTNGVSRAEAIKILKQKGRI